MWNKQKTLLVSVIYKVTHYDSAVVWDGAIGFLKTYHVEVVGSNQGEHPVNIVPSIGVTPSMDV